LNAPIVDGLGGNVHIQTDDFRMEISQRGYYQILSGILLANKQLSCYKNKEGIKIETNVNNKSNIEEYEYYEAIEITELFKYLNKCGVRYVLIKNIANELPNKLKIGKDIDLLIHSEDMGEISNILTKYGYKQIEHPQSITNGFSYAYGCNENFRFYSEENGLYLDIREDLCIKAFSMKTWLPLDSIINDRIWDLKQFDEINGWWILDEITLFVYLIARCVFDKRYFSKEYIETLKKYKH
jgi:hypothetical protein